MNGVGRRRELSWGWRGSICEKSALTCRIGEEDCSLDSFENNRYWCSFFLIINIYVRIKLTFNSNNQQTLVLKWPFINNNLCKKITNELIKPFKIGSCQNGWKVDNALEINFDAQKHLVMDKSNRNANWKP